EPPARAGLAAEIGVGTLRHPPSPRRRSRCSDRFKPQYLLTPASPTPDAPSGRGSRRGPMIIDAALRRKRFHEVAERIEAMIRSGEFAIGDLLPSERELMERFQVG